MEFRQEDLARIGEAHNVEIALERIEERVGADGVMREETLGKPIEAITQEVVTVDADDESAFRSALAAIYETYRSPRTPYGFWGSTEEGKGIARELANRTGGGW
jgi:hypothetical protein